jgi:hypothetical protein
MRPSWACFQIKKRHTDVSFADFKQKSEALSGFFRRLTLCLISPFLQEALKLSPLLAVAACANTYKIAHE